MSTSSVTNARKGKKNASRTTMHISKTVNELIEDKIESPLRTVKMMLMDLAFDLLDHKTEIRAKQASLAKFDKKFGKEEVSFIAK